MKPTTLLVDLLFGCLLFGCAQTQTDEAPQPFAEFRGTQEVARTAVSKWVQKGESSIPEIKAGLEVDSAKVQRYCMEALAKITGQWGWQDGLLWKRSVAEAKELGKPMMVLHLFGNFDEEFC